MMSEASCETALAARKHVASISELELHPAQLRFRRSQAKMKAALCTRRAGKTTAADVAFIEDSQRFPGRAQFFFGLTQRSAESAGWPIMYDILDRYGIAHSYSTVTKLVTFPNRSSIRFVGVDASPQDMKRLLGGAIHAGNFDEPQDYTQSFKDLVYDVILPATASYRHDGGGILSATGTPGDRMGDHLWWQITRHDRDGNPCPERLAGWEVHEWGWADNPGTSAELAEIIRDLERFNPSYRSDPGFRRNYLGKWALDLDTSVYKFDESRNGCTDPLTVRSILAREKRWTFVLGFDVGWEDASALVLLAYSASEQRAYVVRSEYVPKATYDAMAEKMRAYVREWGVSSVVMDAGGGGGKFQAESFRQDHGLPIAAADKQEKRAAVARLNSDLIGGRLQVLEGNGELTNEWQTLRLDRKALDVGKWEESERYRNHLADACLYAHRFCFHRHSPPDPQVGPTHKPTNEELEAEDNARRFRPRQMRRRGDEFDALELRLAGAMRRWR